MISKDMFNLKLQRYQKTKRTIESLERALLAANKRIKELEQERDSDYWKTSVE